MAAIIKQRRRAREYYNWVKFDELKDPTANFNDVLEWVHQHVFDRGGLENVIGMLRLIKDEVKIPAQPEEEEEEEEEEEVVDVNKPYRKKYYEQHPTFDGSGLSKKDETIQRLTEIIRRLQEECDRLNAKIDRRRKSQAKYYKRWKKRKIDAGELYRQL